jgi:hypothetical protein
MEVSKDFIGCAVVQEYNTGGSFARDRRSEFPLFSLQLQQTRGGPRFDLTNFQGRLKTIFATIHNRLHMPWLNLNQRFFDKNEPDGKS